MPKGRYRDHIVFNGHDLSSLVMCRMGRPILPPVNVSTQTVGGRHGEHYRRSRMEGYDIPVDIWLRTEDRRKVAELRHELAALLWTEEPAPLWLPDDPTRYHLAVLSGDTDLGAITSELPTTTLTFHVCDPIAFGDERSEVLVSGTAKTLSAGGTWEAWPIVRSTLSGGTWRITNQTTGQYVEVNADSYGANPAAGASLACDMELERVTINGNTAGVAISSDFFSLSGDATLLVTGARGETTIDWRERWL